MKSHDRISLTYLTFITAAAAGQAGGPATEPQLFKFLCAYQGDRYVHSGRFSNQAF